MIASLLLCLWMWWLCFLLSLRISSWCDIWRSCVSVCVIIARGFIAGLIRTVCNFPKIWIVFSSIKVLRCDNSHIGGDGEIKTKASFSNRIQSCCHAEINFLQIFTFQKARFPIALRFKAARFVQYKKATLPIISKAVASLKSTSIRFEQYIKALFPIVLHLKRIVNRFPICCHAEINLLSICTVHKGVLSYRLDVGWALESRYMIFDNRSILVVQQFLLITGLLRRAFFC